MNSIQNPQTDYSIKTQTVVPSYRFAKLYKTTGGQDITVGTSLQETEFELPTRCMNLSRSKLRFTATPTAAGADPNFNWIYKDLIPCFRQIQLTV